MKRKEFRTKEYKQYTSLWIVEKRFWLIENKKEKIIYKNKWNDLLHTRQRYKKMLAGIKKNISKL